MSSGATSINSQHNLNSPKPSGDKEIYEFGDFRLDPARLMLYRMGQPVALAPKVIETLLALVERQGEVVGKEELMERLWAETAVEESNLTQNIYLLRKTLGERADGQPLIETFRRRGYRFNGAVIQDPGIRLDADVKSRSTTEDFEPEPERFVFADAMRFEVGAAEGVSAAELPQVERRERRRLITAGAILACVALAFICLSAARFFERLHSPVASLPVPPPAAITLKRLTPDIYAVHPTISPDGRYLVYGKRENNKGSLWLMEMATGVAKQIMPPTTEGYDSFQFSPDGSQLYYGTHRKNVPG